MKVIPETYLMKVIPETYLMKVIPETRRAHSIWYLRFYFQLHHEDNKLHFIGDDNYTNTVS